MHNTILITGATSGIGEATLRIFAKKGWKIVATYYTAFKKAEEISQEFGDLVDFYELDLTDDESIKHAADNIQRNHSNIGTLLNNAGCVDVSSLEDTSFESIDLQIRTNLSGMIKFTKLIIPAIKEQVLNVGSKLAKMGLRDYVTYSASKWGVRGFTKGLADEYQNLKFLTINPGLTKTKMTENLSGGVDPIEVGKIIYSVVVGEMEYDSGSDVDVYKLI